MKLIKAAWVYFDNLLDGKGESAVVIIVLGLSLGSWLLPSVQVGPDLLRKMGDVAQRCPVNFVALDLESVTYLKYAAFRLQCISEENEKLKPLLQKERQQRVAVERARLEKIKSELGVPPAQSL